MKDDVAELFRQGRQEQIGAAVDAARPMREGATFERFSSRVVTERANRLKNASEILQFGVRFLDVALGGITKHDLILIGARTSAGKTELVRYIAMFNAARGKRVHFLALEADPLEIERRTKYPLMVDMIYKDNRVSYEQRERLNFMDWINGKLEDVTGRYEEVVDRVLAEKFSTLHTLYRVKDFNVGELEKKFSEIAEETDLVVLDHLHYVDTNDPNENRGYKVIVKCIRDLALRLGKPVIVVAHLRKGDRGRPMLVPEIDDFHGTSDVPKMATKAIILAPAKNMPSGVRGVWNTYIAPVKCRVDGSRARYVACVPFDARTNAYQNTFVLGEMTKGGTEFEPVPECDLPRWAFAERKQETAPTGHWQDRGER